MKPIGNITELIKRAQQLGDRPAYTFVKRNDYTGHTLTYRELSDQVNHLSAQLQQHSTEGDRILLMFPQGIEFILSFFAVINASRIAVPADIPRTKGFSDRIQRIVDNCEASTIITLKRLVDQVKSHFTTEVQVLAIEDLQAAPPVNFTAVNTRSGDIAFIQYTSGSTGEAKGVTISHENLLANQALIQKAFQTSAESVIVGWLPFYHDMGLVGNVIHNLYVGAHAVLFSPVDFLVKPKMWLELISKYKGTVSGAPNFAYQHCTDRVSGEDLVTIDLSSWAVAFCGAEMVKPQTLNDFARHFASSGFSADSLQPCYGMAETTLLVSASTFGKGVSALNKTESELQWLSTAESHGQYETAIVNCGKPTGFELVLVDANGNACKEAQVGEIWLKGKSISKGYWGIQDKSFEQYHEGKGPFFNTGDLGFLQGGQLYLTGRKKELIIIRGRNHYPHDIEALVTRQHKLLIDNRCAAFSINEEAGEKLVIVCEISGKAGQQATQLIERIQKALSAELGIAATDILFIKKNGLPLTTSGKIQRNKCRQQFLKQELPIIESNQFKLSAAQDLYFNADEERVKQCVEFLVPHRITSRTSSLLSMGLDSLNLVQLSQLLSAQFEKDIPLDLLFEVQDIPALTEAILELPDNAIQAPDHTAPTFPLTRVQSGIWYDHDLYPSDRYNISTLVPVSSDLSADVLNHRLHHIIANQEILKCIFTTADGEVQHKISHNTHYQIETLDCREANETQVQAIVKEQVKTVFDLSEWPLFKIKLIRLAENEQRLLIVFHHIIADGHSLSLLVNALIDERQESFSRLDQSYRTYVAWWQQYEQSAAYQTDGQYWLRQFRGKVPFELPYHKKSDQSGTGSITHALTATQYQQIKATAGELDTTPYSVMLSLFLYLMQRTAASENATVGVPVHGRSLTSFQQMLGVCINPIMIDLDGRNWESTRTMIDRCSTQLQAGLKHQKYPLNELLNTLYTEDENFRSRYITRVFFNGLDFAGTEQSKQFFDAFRYNPGTESYQDLNCYVFLQKDELKIRLDYNMERVDAAETERLLFQYQHLIDTLLPALDKAPAALVPHLPITQKEKETVLSFARGPEMPLPTTSLIAQIAEQVTKNPDHVAYRFHDFEVTYREVWKQSDTIAALLREKGLGKHDLVPIMMSKTPDFPIAILGCLKAGAAYVPFDIGWPEERTNMLLQDLNPKVILLDKAERSDNLTTSYQALSIDSITEQRNFKGSHDYDPEALMYGIYTSGTTGKPKCTLNKQIGVLNRFADMTARFGGQELTLLFSSRQSFDVSFWQMFWPLTTGAKVVIPADQQGFDPEAFLELIIEEKINLVDLVPSVFNLLVEYLEQKQQNLPVIEHLQQILVGGEVISPGHVNKFMAWYPQVQLYNTYGPTETAMGTLFYPIDEEYPVPIPLGKPMRNVTAVILNRAQELAAIGETGELYLGGACVGAGYHQLPEKTAAVFIDNAIAELKAPTLYRTGDLAYYLPSGDIQFAGRSDSQIKINGIRIELGEIESQIASIDGVEKALVVTLKHQDKLTIAAYYSGEEAADEDHINHLLSLKLPQYMVPQHLAKLNDWPLLPSGKLDFSKLPKFTERALKKQYAPPRNEEEAALTSVVAQVLSVSEERIGREDNLFSLGVDSLKATKIQLQVQQLLGKQFELRQIFENPSVASLSPFLTTYKQETSVANHNPKLSKAQQRIWVQCQSEETSIANNLPILLELKGELDHVIVQKALQAVVNEHDILRTVFPAKSGIPDTLVLNGDDAELKLAYQALHEEELQKHLRPWLDQPFDLATDPLLRALLVKVADQKHYLALCIHHLITDAWSVDLMMKAFAEQFYAIISGKSKGTTISGRYQEAIALKEQYNHSAQFKADQKYWQNRFSQGVPEFSWPTDFPRPKKRTFDNAVVHMPLTQELARDLTAYCEETQHSKFAFVFSCVNLLLYRYTGQRQVVLGFPVSGRNHPETQNQLGLFINTLVLNTKVDADADFTNLLNTVSKDLLAVMEHQQFEYEDLLDLLNPDLEAGRNPLFDISVVMDKTDLYAETMEVLPGLEVARKELDKKYILSDVNVILRESNDQLKLSVEYNRNLYADHTIRHFTSHLVRLMAEVMNAPTLPVHELNFLSNDEHQQLLVDYNQTETPYPRDSNVVTLFRQQARIQPESPALLQDEVTITYSELDKVTDHHAQRLIRHIGNDHSQEEIIPIFSNDPLVTIIAALSILKAGLGYMPVNPAFPSERIALMLEQGKAKTGIAEHGLKGLETLPFEPFLLDPNEQNLTEETVFVWPERQPLSPCYVMYTSGSTGQPKGVVGLDRNVVRLVKNNRLLPLTPEDRLLQTSPMTFDPSVMEVWGALLNGASLQLTGKAIILNPEALQETLVSQKITTLWLTTPIFVEMASINPAIFKSLKKVIVGGDRLPGDIASSFVNACPDTRLTNAYGPTENGVFSTCYQVATPVPEIIPIGKAINNTQVYILDDRLQPVPAGVAGTLFVGGDGLPKGYFDEGLTEKLFVTNPFDASKKLYETGDLGKWLPDGNIRFLGRKDRQIKINGIRIELGEIESLLNKYKGVRTSLVLFEDESIRAYLASDSDLNVEDIKAYLSRYLIEIMIPEQFFVMESFPLTHNGKVDVKALPRPVQETVLYANPDNKEEQKLREIWAEILKMPTEEISTTHDFFDLGGNSLLLGRIIIRIKEHYKVQLSYRELFDNRSITSQARLLEEQRPTVEAEEAIPVLDRSQYRM